MSDRATVREETALSRELRAHRAGHPECDGLHCTPYLDLCRKYTEPRMIWEGPTMAHSRLSILEAR